MSSDRESRGDTNDGDVDDTEEDQADGMGDDDNNHDDYDDVDGQDKDADGAEGENDNGDEQGEKLFNEVYIIVVECYCVDIVFQNCENLMFKLHIETYLNYCTFITRL